MVAHNHPPQPEVNSRHYSTTHHISSATCLDQLAGAIRDLFEANVCTSVVVPFLLPSDAERFFEVYAPSFANAGLSVGREDRIALRVRSSVHINDHVTVSLCANEFFR